MPIRYIAFISILISLPVLAQETMSGSTQTGTILPTEEELIWIDRTERANDFRIKMLELRTTENNFALYLQNYWQNQIENSNNCKNELRKSNKFSLFPTKLRCYRTELVNEKEYWEKQKSHAETINGISEEIRTHVLNKINNLTDAISSIINGIDNGVFTNEKDVLEAKKNLHHMYRLPSRVSVLHYIASRNRTWTAYILIRLNTLKQEIGNVDEEQTIIDEIMQCFNQTEKEWKEIEEITDYTEAFSAWENAQNSNKKCILKLKKANELL